MTSNCLFSFQVGSKHYCFLEYNEGLILDMAFPPGELNFKASFTWKWEALSQKLWLSRSILTEFPPLIRERANAEYVRYIGGLAAGVEA